MTNFRTWTAGQIRVAGEDGRSYHVAGWTKGLFGLDYRPLRSPLPGVAGAWGVTHLLTGHAVVAVLGDFGTACLVVADIETWGDWQFTDQADIAERFRGRVKALQGRFPDLIYNPMEAPIRLAMTAPGDFLCQLLDGATPAAVAGQAEAS